MKSSFLFFILLPSISDVFGGLGDNKWREELCKACNGQVLFTNDTFFCVMKSRKDMACVNWEVASLRGVNLKPLVIPSDVSSSKGRRVRQNKDETVDIEPLESDSPQPKTKDSHRSSPGPLDILSGLAGLSEGRQWAGDPSWSGDPSGRSSPHVPRYEDEVRRREQWENQRQQAANVYVVPERVERVRNDGREAGVHEVRLGGSQNGDAFLARTQFARGDAPWPWTPSLWAESHPQEPAYSSNRPAYPGNGPLDEVSLRYHYPERDYRRYDRNYVKPGGYEPGYQDHLRDKKIPPHLLYQPSPVHGYPVNGRSQQHGGDQEQIPPQTSCVNRVLQLLSEQGLLEEQERREAIREFLESERNMKMARNNQKPLDSQMSVPGRNPSDPVNIAEQIASSVARTAERLFHPPKEVKLPNSPSQNHMDSTNGESRHSRMANTQNSSPTENAPDGSSSPDVYSVGPMLSPASLKNLFRLPTLNS